VNVRSTRGARIREFRRDRVPTSRTRYDRAAVSEPALPSTAPPDGFITDAEWLSDRLGRALARVRACEIALAAAPEGSVRRHAAERSLHFALDEVAAYEGLLREAAPEGAHVPRALT
jgi:hypothetical protein